MIQEIGAGNETRTRDPDLGKVVLYQLSYSRVATMHCKENSTSLLYFSITDNVFMTNFL